MKNLYALITVGIIALSSCVGPSVYTPITTERQQMNPYYVLPSPNAPLIQNKGDITGGINTFFTDTRFDLDVFVAYEPAKHFGLIARYTNQNDDVEQSDGYYFGSWHNSRGEFGAGYNLTLSKEWMAECYAGGGFGTLKNDHASGYSTIKHGYYFLQPAVGYHNLSETIELGLVVRLNGVHTSIEEARFDTSGEYYTTKQFQLMQATPMNWMIEPGMIFRFGWPHVKFQLSANYAANLTNSDLESKPFHFSWGTVLKFNTVKKKSPKTIE